MRHRARVVLAGKAASSPNHAFWETEGAAYAQAALAFALLVSRKEGWDRLLPTVQEGSERRQQIVAFGRFAGLAGGRRGSPPFNALAVAKRALGDFFAVSGAAEFLVDVACGEDESDEAGDLRRAIRYIDKIRVAEQQYAGTLAEARRCFHEFAEDAPARSLLFGVEGAVPTVDFSAAVDAEGGRTIFVLQPEDNSADTMIAKAIKGAFFEAVLNSPARRERGGEMPLVGYVADEFHRFATTDESHGEQNFLDRCRSFGTACVLATQSDASIAHALELAGEPSPGTAIRLLLTNTATKLAFRSTEGGRASPDRRHLPWERTPPCHGPASAFHPAARRVLREPAGRPV